ncbi:MAG: Biopolymer transport protein ExbD [bacterium ADurb.Bin429]|nr:MAG: Biopolymer transport protein ExbD [bacterium ADurb.Bin429]
MIRSKSSRQVKFISDINITPFTDVCLVLLIIFMVTAPEMVRESQFHLSLPKAATAEAAMPASVTVRITPEQQVFVNNSESSFASLREDIRKVHEETKARLLVVKADETVPYRLVIETIDIARSEGVDQIGLATRKQETTPVRLP